MPKELYVIDLTEVPKEFKEDNEKIYIISIIDHFSKFAKNFVIDKKDQNTVLEKINEFIDLFGKPQKILTDNGKEFKNKKFNNYCHKNEINLIHGRPRHPQTQGLVERYNRTIKDMLKNKFIECKKNKIIFVLENELDKLVNIYNETKHSSTGFPPNYLFNCTDEKIFKKVINNTKKNFRKKNIHLDNIENRCALLCENILLNNNKITKAAFGGKGRYLLPIRIISSSSSDEYKIKFEYNFKNIKKDFIYYVDYNLLKLCDDKTWKELNINYTNLNK